MSGVLCLQGGREFTSDCDEMDLLVVESAAVSSIAVLAGAARVGSDHDGAVKRALDHFRRLGIDGIGVPDPRIDASAALAALARLDTSVDLVVLPGGSPGSLLDVLHADDGVGEFVRSFHRAGGAISGASAGAMVLCERMVRPERGEVVAGLGLVDGLALPHWAPDAPLRWDVGDSDLWGLPECGGALLVPGADPIAVGRGDAARRIDGAWRSIRRLSG